jgi:hypothetical protein
LPLSKLPEKRICKRFLALLLQSDSEMLSGIATQPATAWTRRIRNPAQIAFVSGRAKILSPVELTRRLEARNMMTSYSTFHVFHEFLHGAARAQFGSGHSYEETCEAEYENEMRSHGIAQ